MTDERFQRRVGAAVLGALALVIVLAQGTDWRGCVRSRVRVWVEIDRSAALRVGSQVQIAGHVVGEVEGIRFLPRVPDGDARVRLEISVEREHAHLLRRNSQFFVGQVGLLSEPFLEIGLPAGAEPGPPLGDGATVRGVDPPDLDQLLRKAYASLRAIADLVRGLSGVSALRGELAELERTLSALDPTLAAGLADSAHRLAGEVDALFAALEVPEMIGLADAAQRVVAIVARARLLAARASESLALVRGRIELLEARIDGRHERLGRTLVRAKEIMVGLEALVSRADAVVALAGTGTIGAFLADGEIADDVKDTVRLLIRAPWNIARPPLDSSY